MRIPLDEVAEMLPPVQLQTSVGEPIDVAGLRGYAGPAVFDQDGDGRPDLLVGSFSGGILLFRNHNEPYAPLYERGTPLQAEGEDIRISNW